jgi:hypothetical protein
MEITVDFASLGDNPLEIMWTLFIKFGWVVFALFFIYALLIMWQNRIREDYRKTRKYILLAIDVPKNNIQSPRAVENIFSHLAGAHQPLKFVHNWWFGEIKNSFSFELVSIGGYTQFIIHTMDAYRDLVEAIMYAQYPNAEITEIEDYTERYKNVRFPNKEYDLFGLEIKLSDKEVFPLLTYEVFEDPTAEEEKFKDPMASILEAFGRIGENEELWLQFVITPADNDWGKAGKPVIKKLIGEATERKRDLLDKAFDGVNMVIDTLVTPPESKKKDGGQLNKIQYMTTGEKNAVEAVERKVSKIGFHSKIRLVYIAKKGFLVKSRVTQGVYGSLKQFNHSLNGLKPDGATVTGGVVWFKKSRIVKRQNAILKGYLDRGHSMAPGTYGFILNTEELATLWHFPVMGVKAPSIKRTETKKIEPPITLPTSDQNVLKIKKQSPPLATPLPPENLPTEEDDEPIE